MDRKQVTAGWIAVALSTLIAALWAYWGIGEAFHEGWWAPTLGGRLLQTVAYMVPMAMCLAIGVLAVRWPKLGGIVYVAIGTVFSLLVFGELAPDFRLQAVLSWLPVTLLVILVGVLWWFGKPRPVNLAYGILVGVPLLVALVAGASRAYKVSTRLTDVSPDAQIVAGNGVTLVWAPTGPGWVRDAQASVSWAEARDICARLSEDGTYLMDEPQHIWRLPTVDEAVRSMARHGRNSGGVWDAEARRASYVTPPDKEPPLWDPFAETIYWWTGTEAGENEAFIIAFDGSTLTEPKTRVLGSRRFRAVKDHVGGGRAR